MQSEKINMIAQNNYNFGAVAKTKQRNNKSAESIFLQDKLQSVKDEQGLFGNIWNGFKETFNVGVTQSKCDKMLQGYLNGSVSFDEAVEYIEKFENKQKNMSDLMVNVITGVGGIAVATTAVAAGPIGWGVALSQGAPIGAAIKAGLKVIDRATNNVENDAFDAKLMAKDAISGAITGATSALSSNVGIGIKEAVLKKSLVNGAKCSSICGAVSGAASYMSDVVLDDKEFDAGDFAKNVFMNSAVSGSVGLAVGGGLYGSASLAGNIGKDIEISTLKTIFKDSCASSLRKALISKEKDILFT